MSTSQNSGRAVGWRSRIRHRPFLVASEVVVGLLVGLVTVPGGIAIVTTAAGIPKGSGGLGGFVRGAGALVTPLLIMAAAVAPLCLIGGGLVLLFGGRRGMQIIGTSLGVLLLLGSVTAIIK